MQRFTDWLKYDYGWFVILFCLFILLVTLNKSEVCSENPDGYGCNGIEDHN
jgi:hypothetical protein